jgi:hypothetical protein
MQTMIDNLINGNLTDAKRQAKRFSKAAIAAHLFSIGWSVRKSAAGSCYLKGEITFQQYCDATQD